MSYIAARDAYLSHVGFCARCISGTEFCALGCHEYVLVRPCVIAQSLLKQIENLF